MKWTATVDELGDAFHGNGLTNTSEVCYRCVFRLIVLQRQVLVLWEAVADWETTNHHCPQEKRMRLKGWQVVRPFEELGEAVSLAQAGVTVNVFGSDASILNPQAISVMRSLELFGRRQAQSVDNLLLDDVRLRRDGL